MFYVVVKKDKMVTERLDAQIEKKKKMLIIITLVTIMITLL